MAVHPLTFPQDHFLCVLTVPANDSVFDNLLEMRQRLGWVTDIPRHGPDCKKDMLKLSDKPLTEKVNFLNGLGEIVEWELSNAGCLYLCAMYVFDMSHRLLLLVVDYYLVLGF